MTPGQVANLVGCHPGTIRNRIRDGELKATRNPAKTGTYRINRDSLIRWLLKANWSAEDIRRACPLPGPLFVASLSVQDTATRFAREPHRRFNTLFDLALQIHVQRPWGILFDLPSIGVHATVAQLSLYRDAIDRPLLLAICSDDFTNRGAFDVCIPELIPAGKIAQRVRAYRP